MASRKLEELVFKHLVEVVDSQCVFCSTFEKSTGRTKLFLVFRKDERIYRHNGLKRIWNSLDEEETACVRRQFDCALKERSVPCYTTLKLDNPRLPAF